MLRRVELRAGSRLDRYTLVSALGEGGQATVWKAIDPLDGGAVRALKVFRMSAGSADDGERARREAKAVAGSHHPGLLPCRTLIEDPAAGLVVLVFDYARGQSLADALADPRMTIEHRSAAVRQLADTLAYVHGRGVLHRDVKPDNVLVTDLFWRSPEEAGTLKLVDFGIAASAGNPKPLTREGGVVGTTPYLPPELLDATGSFGVGDDYQRDVFAFGVLAWEVLIGGHPTGLPLGASRDAFAGVYLSSRAGKRAWPPPAPASRELAVLQACLSLSPASRPLSCVVVADALRTGVLDSTAPRTSDPMVTGHRVSRSSGTDLHVAPRTEPGAAMPSLWGQVASPFSGNAQPLSGAGPTAPVGIPRPPPSARKGSAAPWIAVGLAAGLAMVGLVLLGGYLATGSSAPSVSPSSGEPTSPPTAPTRARALEPPTAPQGPAPTPKIVPCCQDAGACRSGRQCRPSPCDSLDDGPWRLRVIGGSVQQGAGSVEIQRTWRSSQICIRNTRTGEEQCASSNKMWTLGSDPEHRVLATTADISQGNLIVRIAGAPDRIEARAFGSPTGYKATALCIGVKLHLREYEHDVGNITVFLDDPEDR